MMKEVNILRKIPDGNYVCFWKFSKLLCLFLSMYQATFCVIISISNERKLSLFIREMYVAYIEE